MQTVIEFVHDNLVREVADSFAREGFAVALFPRDERLPNFLKGLRPDLIVTTPEKKIIVGVSSGAGNVEEWAALRRAVEGRPGWDFELAVNWRRRTELEREVAPNMTIDQIRHRLATGRELATVGSLDMAVVAIWPALEAALRESAATQRLLGAEQGPRALIAILERDGDLMWVDYKELNRLCEIADRAIHGYRVDDLQRADIESMERIALATLNRIERADRRRKRTAKSTAVAV